MVRWIWVYCCAAALVGLLLAGEAVREAQQPRPEGGQSLGAYCDVDADCATGLECIEIEGVLEGQCAAGCSSTESCRLRFGAGALCIGADVCVQVCERDADCPGDAFCNRYAWCEKR